MRRTGDGIVIAGLLLGAAALFGLVYLLMNGGLDLSFGSNDEAAVPPGYERQVGDLAITVTSVLRPADEYLLQQGISNSAANVYAGRPDEEMVMVFLHIRCVSLTKGCPIRSRDFSLRAESSGSYFPIRTGNLEGIGGLFVDNTLKSDSMMDGAFVYLVEKSTRDLMMYYPRFGGDQTMFAIQ